MSVNVSVRLDDRLAERLRLRACVAGETLSDRLRRYAEEGVRRDEHPLITFRDGPNGRRAGVVGGADVWQIAMWLDEMYPAALATALKAAGIETNGHRLRFRAYLIGRPDAEVFATAVAGGYVVLTEDVREFTRFAAECNGSGKHHPGLLIALASQFSRRPAGIKPLTDAIKAVAHQQLDDRVVYLDRPHT